MTPAKIILSEIARIEADAQKAESLWKALAAPECQAEREERDTAFMRVIKGYAGVAALRSLLERFQ